MNGCIDAVNILVNQYICDVNHVSGMDCANGFMYACRYGHEEIVELLRTTPHSIAQLIN